MTNHHVNRNHVKWCLEATCAKLAAQFPQHFILVIRPSKFFLNTFACYENFVDVTTDTGVPRHCIKLTGFTHLHALLENLAKRVGNPHLFDQIKLIAFSKGCVVLNQFLHEFKAVEDYDERESPEFIKANSLVQAITDMYWIDGGHSGGSKTWIADRHILACYAKLATINTHVIVSPYQINCQSRPWIGKEEAKFTSRLNDLGHQVRRSFVQPDEERDASIETHFELLERINKLNKS